MAVQRLREEALEWICNIDQTYMSKIDEQGSQSVVKSVRSLKQAKNMMREMLSRGSRKAQAHDYQTTAFHNVSAVDDQGSNPTSGNSGAFASRFSHLSRMFHRVPPETEATSRAASENASSGHSRYRHDGTRTTVTGGRSRDGKYRIGWRATDLKEGDLWFFFRGLLGRDGNGEDLATSSPLYVACRDGLLEVIVWYLRAGCADLETRFEGGRTPLLVAAASGRPEVRMSI